MGHGNFSENGQRYCRKTIRPCYGRYTIFLLYDFGIRMNLKRGDNLEAKLQKWGNSLGIRIPSSLLKALNLKNNDQVDINYEDDKIVISKSKNNKISLEERFKEYKGENLAKEFNWDLPRGKEIW